MVAPFGCYLIKSLKNVSEVIAMPLVNYFEQSERSVRNDQQTCRQRTNANGSTPCDLFF
jgi:hypothetical protein